MHFPVLTTIFFFLKKEHYSQKQHTVSSDTHITVEKWVTKRGAAEALKSNLDIRCYISLRKHPFLLALRRWGRFAQNIPSSEEPGETDVFAG